MAWRFEQRAHEQRQGTSATAATLWRAQAMTGRQRLRQARALRAELQRPLVRSQRSRRRARALVARYRLELGWQRAVLADYRGRAGFHAAAAAELRLRVVGP
jgi:hypothetical protein